MHLMCFKKEIKNMRREQASIFENRYLEMKNLIIPIKNSMDRFPYCGSQPLKWPQVIRTSWYAHACMVQSYNVAHLVSVTIRIWHKRWYVLLGLGFKRYSGFCFKFLSHSHSSSLFLCLSLYLYLCLYLYLHLHLLLYLSYRFCFSGEY